MKPEDVFPGADHFDPIAGTPPSGLAKMGHEELGAVVETSDIGCSGKPVGLLIGMDKHGDIVGSKVIEHHESILPVGIACWISASVRERGTAAGIATGTWFGLVVMFDRLLLGALIVSRGLLGEHVFHTRFC